MASEELMSRQPSAAALIHAEEAAKRLGETTEKLAEWRRQRKGPKYHLASKDPAKYPCRPMYLASDVERLKDARAVMSEMRLLHGQKGKPAVPPTASKYFRPRKKMRLKGRPKGKLSRVSREHSR